jgi:transposase-like protein
MARKSKDSELREAWQEASTVGDDGMRALVERVVQQVLEAEMSSFLQADSYERTGERRGYRNGYKPRLLKTRVGELELLPRRAVSNRAVRALPAQREGSGSGDHADVCGGRLNA